MADVYLRATLSPFTRDDPRYWTRGRPADHTPAGLFADGPEEAIPPTNKQAHSGRWHAVGKFAEKPAHDPRPARSEALSRQKAAAYRRLALAIGKAA